MEIREFIKGYKRMCGNGFNCKECSFINDSCNIEDLKDEDISKVEQWIEEHPIMTNAQKFKEVFGVEPKKFNGTYICCPFIRTKEECEKSYCTECEKWWDEEYITPKGE